MLLVKHAACDALATEDIQACVLADGSSLVSLADLGHERERSTVSGGSRELGYHEA